MAIELVGVWPKVGGTGGHPLAILQLSLCWHVRVRHYEVICVTSTRYIQVSVN